MPTVPSNMIAPPAGDPVAQDAVPTMGRRQPAWRARLNPDALWKQLTRRNMTQNELARRAKISSGGPERRRPTRNRAPQESRRLPTELPQPDRAALLRTAQPEAPRKGNAE